MNIAYVNADHGIPVFGNKGASIHIQELTNALVGLGHEVTLLAARIGERTDSARANVVKVRSDMRGQREVGQSGNDKGLANEQYRLSVGRAMEDALVAHHHITPFDFIYERYSLWSAAGVRAASRIGIPCIVEVNAPLLLEQQRYRNLVLESEAQAIEAEVFGSAATLVAVSEEVRSYTIEAGAARQRTVVVPNGVDTERFTPTGDAAVIAGIDPDAFVIGFVGSLKAWHDHTTLLDSFAALFRLDPSYHLLIVGDGPTRDWIDGYTRGAGLDGHVTITGWSAHDELPALLRRMDVAVAPYAQLDGFYFSPLKLFEYMAAGRPIVASAIGQVRDTIEDGVSGLFATPEDVADLAEKIRHLRADPSLRASLGAAATYAVREKTWRNNALRTIEIVERLREAA